jgi:hypothetical protein
MTINITTALATDYDRASLMWSYAGDPRGLMADLMAAVAESQSEDGRIPEAICRPASAVLGAAMLYDVWLRVGDDGQGTEYDYSESMAACQILEHAAYDHGDALALSIVGSESLAVAVERIESWVLANLADAFAEVIELAEYASEFDAWDLAASTPDATPDDVA